MKKYKLIKEYPGSPKLGTIAEKDPIASGWYRMVNTKMKFQNKLIDEDNVENHPEFWEEIVQKDYEIISYKNFLTGSIHTIGQMFFSNEGYRKFSELDVNSKRIEDGRKVYSIYSVKRLSDGEVFTIGDNIMDGKINNIQLSNNEMWLFHNGKRPNIKLKDAIKVKTPLFTTEDGVDIYHGEIYYIIKNNSFVISRKADENYSYSSMIKKFSTFEKAEEYILYNTKSLSLNDLINIFASHHMSALQLIDDCKKFIKNNK